MTEAYLGQVQLFPYDFVPKGWVECAGQSIPVSQNQALYALLGTTYGGDGTMFRLPDLRGRAGLGYGSAYPLGASAGTERHTLTTAQIPSHVHLAQGAGAATTTDPTGATWAAVDDAAYAPPSGALMADGAIGATGGGQSHENMPPYLTMTYAICVAGLYPSRG